MILAFVGAGVARAADDKDQVSTLVLFGSLAEARQHCPGEAVIRMVLPEGFYLHGDRGFGGVSLNQVFVCRAEAMTLFAPRAPARQGLNPSP